MTLVTTPRLEFTYLYLMHMYKKHYKGGLNDLGIFSQSTLG